jgi:riboflavin transporter FmnP
MKQNKSILQMTLSAMFIAIGFVLPFLTGQIPQIGRMMLPMHIPVLLCGLICGPQYGLIVGAVTPLLRGALTGMPVLYPVAIAMTFELATYGFVSGYLYSRSKWQCIRALYRCLILAMITGRIVWGIAEMVLLGVTGKAFTFQMFLAGAVLDAIPGIILQLIFIPAIMAALNKTGLVPFVRRREQAEA